MMLLLSFGCECPKAFIIIVVIIIVIVYILIINSYIHITNTYTQNCMFLCLHSLSEFVCVIYF